MKARRLGDVCTADFSRITWRVCFLMCFIVNIVTGSQTWSDWYDGTAMIGMSNATLDMIKEIIEYDCPSTSIIDVQCQAKGPSSSTLAPHSTMTSSQNEDSLFLVPCLNNSEIQCTIQYQIFLVAATCNDYEIRFLCQVADSTQSQKTSDTISVNGGFIAMAAGLSVVVPLICVLVLQLRRAKREERARRRAEAQGSENGATGQATDPPPSYEQVFGSNYHPVTPAHSRDNSLNILIDESETDMLDSQSRGRDNEVRSPNILRVYLPPDVTRADSDNENSEATFHGARYNPAYSSTSSVAIISGSRVADMPAAPNGQSSTNTNREDSSHVNSPSSQPRYLLNNSSLQSHFDIQSALSSSSAPSPLGSQPPPLSPGSFQNSHSNINQNSGTSSSHRPLTRFPGMHISIEEIFSLSDWNQNEVPPPSYEEALKILELDELTRKRDNIIK